MAGVTTDADGNVYATGWVNRADDSSKEDLSVSKYDGDGNLVVRASGDLLMDPGVRDEFGMKLREPVPVRLDCDEQAPLDTITTSRPDRTS